MKPVWDLRETHAIEAVGWPDDAGSAFEARWDAGLSEILLPGGLVIDDAERANPSRRGGIGEVPYSEEVQDLLVTWDRESPAEVLARAERVARDLGIGLGDLPGWAAAAANGTAQPATASSDRGELVDGAGVTLTTRAFPEGDALLRLLVSWPREG